MTDTSEMEVAPNYPPDWRDWINEFPTVKSVALFCVIAWVVTGLLLAIGDFWGYFTNHEPAAGIIRVLEMWLDALNWLTAAAVFGVVGKRATEKPDVIRAEGEAKAAVIAAGTPSVSITSVDPLAPPTPPPAAGSTAPQPATDLDDVPGEGD